MRAALASIELFFCAERVLIEIRQVNVRIVSVQIGFMSDGLVNQAKVILLAYNMIEGISEIFLANMFPSNESNSLY